MDEPLMAITKALNYIESNLSVSIDLTKVASQTGYSLFHFHRVFRAIVGDSLKDYVRKRVMTQAAFDLCHSSVPIIDIAVTYGYESREAFSRSFRKSFGIPPSKMRIDGSFYPLRSSLSDENVAAQISHYKHGLTPTFVTLQSTTVTGKIVDVTHDSHKKIPLLWSEWFKDYPQPKQVMSVCLFSKNDDFNYLIEAPSSESMNIEASNYAVFRVEAPIIENVQKTWNAIYSTWIYSSNYQIRHDFGLERYTFDTEHPYAELYLPIHQLDGTFNDSNYSVNQ